MEGSLVCKIGRCRLLVVGIVSACLLFVTPTWAAGSSTKGIAKLQHQVTKSLCKSFRKAMGSKDFAKSFGRRHSIRSCTTKNRRYMISTRDDLKKKCVSYRKRNPDAFKSKYGSGRKQRGALGRCLRIKLRAAVRLLRRQIRATVLECRADLKSDSKRFAKKYRHRRTAVSLRRCIGSELFRPDHDSRDDHVDNPVDNSFDDAAGNRSGQSESSPDSDPPDMCDATTAERITMTLPFREANRPDSLGPMGETITHPKPQHPRGHPGIDFQWDGSASKQLIASASGVVVTIRTGFYPSTWDLYIVSGCYRIGYGVLGSVAPGLNEGSTVQKGDFIGVPAYAPGTGADMSGFHWEFGYNNASSLYPFRICPMTYFDDSSVQRIEAIWATSTFERKDLFPHICSGDFYGLDS